MPRAPLSSLLTSVLFAAVAPAFFALAAGSQTSPPAKPHAPATPTTKPAPTSPWTLQTSGTTASLRGIHALPGGVAWASGSDGTVLRTEDGGYLWQHCVTPPDAAKLDFRGVWAWDEQTAIVMSSGPGDASRLYKTSDGCQTWKLLATNQFKDGFWDAIFFYDNTHGWLLGDPVDGRFQVFALTLAGDTLSLKQQMDNGLAADPNLEGAFAASNSSLTSHGRTLGYLMIFGSGGKGGAYLISMDSRCICVDDCSAADVEKCDQGKWSKMKLPLAGGSGGAGAFSIATLIGRDLIILAVGGDYEKPAESAGTAAYSLDAGATWKPASVPPHGYRSAVAWDEKNKVWIAAGTNGSDFSRDNGKTWAPLDDGAWNALSLPYVVGPKGRIAKLADAAIPLK
jgi:photosystem II stability/assembly factor-like uncharacterized protein